LDSLLTKAQAERASKQAQYRQVAEKGANATIFANNTLLTGLRQGVIDQEAKVAGLTKIYDENYPSLKVEKTKLQELRMRLNNEIQNTAAGIKSDYEISDKVEKMLQEALNEQKQKVQNLQANLVKHSILKRDLKTNEQLYHGLLTRMKEASVSSTVIPTNIVRITNAELPIRPFTPNKGRNMMLGLAVGLIGGMILIRVIEYFDDTIKDSLEVERICNLPILGTVPQIRDMGKMADRVVTISDPEMGKYLIDPIRNLRTSIMLSSPGKAPTIITITSPYPSEGKSTVALNLAMALAMHNHKSVIIEADLRKPSLSKYFNAQGNAGLSTYLSGNAHLSSVVQSTDIPNLSIISSGPVPPNPTELLGSKLFRELLEKLKDDFRHIVIDTPPIIGLADGRVVSTISDAVILVVRHNKTSRDGVIIANQLLERDNARMIGYVLNQFVPQHGDRGYYYYYKNYYTKYSHYSS
jgi:capsular exopolysaccharide synthesis family protein